MNVGPPRHRSRLDGEFAGVIGQLFLCANREYRKLLCNYLGGRSTGKGYQPLMGCTPGSGGGRMELQWVRVHFFRFTPWTRLK